MVFNPNRIKQALEVIFSRKLYSRKHPYLYFNSFVIEKVKIQQNLGLKLDERFNFREHLKNKFTTVNKGIGMLKNLSNYLPLHSLITLYKAFI